MVGHGGGDRHRFLIGHWSGDPAVLRSFLLCAARIPYPHTDPAQRLPCVGGRVLTGVAAAVPADLFRLVRTVLDLYPGVRFSAAADPRLPGRRQHALPGAGVEGAMGLDDCSVLRVVRARPVDSGHRRL